VNVAMDMIISWMQYNAELADYSWNNSISTVYQRKSAQRC
jgi:hypothetical protein